MEIRRFKDTDIDQVIDLFYDTVHRVNRMDYTPEQLAAWANPLERDKVVTDWLRSLRSNHTYVAEENSTILGFIDLTTNGLLDRLYVHKDYQRQGIASALFEVILQTANELHLSAIKTEASITAKPFFEKQGFKELEKQQIEKHGILLINYLMSLPIEDHITASISGPNES